MAQDKIPQDKAEGATTKDVVREFLGEALGIENGFLRTLVDLKKDPARVVESHLLKEHVYLNPFKLLFSIAAVWVIVMNFVLNWNAIGQEYAQQLNDLFAAIGLGDNGSHERLTESKDLTGRIMDALFAKYFLAFIIVLVPLQAFVCTRFTREYGVPVKVHLIVLAYHASLKLLLGFFFALGFGVHVLGTMLVMLVLVISGSLGWKFAYNLYSGIPVERFFREHGPEMDKAYRKTMLVVLAGTFIAAIFGGMVAGLLYL